MKRIFIFAIAVMCMNLSQAKKPVNYTYSEVGQTGVLTMHDIMNYVVGLVRPNDGMWSATYKDMGKALKPYHCVKVKSIWTPTVVNIAYKKYPASYKTAHHIGTSCVFDKNDILQEYTMTFGQEETGFTFDVFFEEVKKDLLAESVVELPELSQQQVSLSTMVRYITGGIMGGKIANKFVGHKDGVRYELLYIKFTEKSQGIVLTVLK